MIEQKWLAAWEHDWVRGWPDATAVELLLERILTLRKSIMFGLACCRSIEHLVPNERCRQAIDVAERFTDGRATETEWQAAHDGSKQVAAIFQRMLNEQGSRGSETHCSAAQASDELIVLSRWTDLVKGNLATIVHQIALMTQTEHQIADHEHGRLRHCLWQGQVLADIIGSYPAAFHFDPSWRSSTAVAIAKGMYDSRDFAQMPLLADALEDAGCADERIIDHCRGPGPHVKGCWVVDLVLGKS